MSIYRIFILPSLADKHSMDVEHYTGIFLTAEGKRKEFAGTRLKELERAGKPVPTEVRNTLKQLSVHVTELLRKTKNTTSIS